MLALIAADDDRPHRPHVHDGRAVEGELVTPVVLGCPDPHCDACQSSWFGLISHGGCPTTMVVDRPGVTEHDLRARVHDWLDCMGTIDRIVQASEAGDLEVDGVSVDDPVTAVDELVSAHVTEINTICATYPVGTVLSRLGGLIAPLHLDAAA